MSIRDADMWESAVCNNAKKIGLIINEAGPVRSKCSCKLSDKDAQLVGIATTAHLGQYCCRMGWIRAKQFGHHLVVRAIFPVITGICLVIWVADDLS